MTTKEKIPSVDETDGKRVIPVVSKHLCTLGPSGEFTLDQNGELHPIYHKLEDDPLRGNERR